MRSVAPFCILLVPLAAVAIATAGPVGAGAAALVGLLLGILGLFLLRGDEVERRAGAGARRESDIRFLVVLVVTGFVLRAGLAVILRQLDLNMVLGGDEGTFDANAHVFQMWLDGIIPEPFQEKWRNSSQVGYFVIVGSMYWLIGPIQIVPVLLNCAIGALTAIPVYRLSARLAGSLSGRIAATLVTFFPSLVLWSCLLVRDALAFFLIAWCVVLGQDLLRRATLPRIVALTACLGVLATLRSYIFLLLAGAIVAAFLVSMTRRPGRALVVAILSTIGILLLVRGAGLGSEFVGEDYLVRIDEQRRLNAIVGNAAIDIGGHDLTTPVGALTYLPIGLAYFLLAPFPWQMGGRQALALPDMLLWYACFPLVLMGIGHVIRRRRVAALVPLLAGVSISMLYGLVEGNVGIIVRHRAQVLVLFLPFAALAATRILRARERRLTVERADRARLMQGLSWRGAGSV